MTEIEDPIVEFRKIDKTYDGVTNIVEGLDLNIGRGEFVTLLGPSGSGKTTLLMMLAGFENPTGGEVLLNGQLLNRVPPYKRNMGVVFQSYALFPHMSVSKNIGYPLVRRGLAKAEITKRVADVLDKVHMGQFAERLPAQLSGGQQQRIALARALVFEPDVVLLDEPLGALDKKLREHMQIEIKRLHETLGMTMVYVTHDQTEALTMSDRIAVFNEGKIVQIGTPEDLYERPNCSFVANFIGEINNFPGRLKGSENGTCAVGLDCGVDAGALKAVDASEGDPVNVAVRPEHVLVSDLDDSQGAVVTGEIRSQIYHGDHLRYEIDVPGCEGITARTAVNGTTRIPTGTRVTLSWSADNARTLDAWGSS